MLFKQGANIICNIKACLYMYVKQHASKRLESEAKMHMPDRIVVTLRSWKKTIRKATLSPNSIDWNPITTNPLALRRYVNRL